MKILTNTPERLELEARSGFLLFIAFIFGLLLMKTGLTAVLTDPGVGSAVYFAGLSAAGLGAVWYFSGRSTITCDAENGSCVIRSGRIGRMTEKALPLKNMVSVTADTSSGKPAVVLSVQDETGTVQELRPGGPGLKPEVAAEVAEAARNWLEAQRG